MKDIIKLRFHMKRKSPWNVHMNQNRKLPPTCLYNREYLKDIHMVMKFTLGCSYERGTCHFSCYRVNYPLISVHCIFNHRSDISGFFNFHMCKGESPKSGEISRDLSSYERLNPPKISIHRVNLSEISIHMK